MAKKEGPKVCANSIMDPRIFFLIDNWAYFTIIIKEPHQIIEIALHIANPSTKMGVAHNFRKKKKASTKSSLDLVVKNVRCQSQMGKIVPGSSIYLEVTRK